MARIIGVIPARFGSTRLPGKMLLDLAGKPLIVRTYESARKVSRFDEVIVATDDQRIRDAIRSVSGRVVMTPSDLPSGSDRVLAAIREIPADIVVNIQGDEPLIPAEVVDRTIALLLDHPEFDVTTAAAPLDPARVNDPSAVKVVTDQNGRSLYFSRSTIPFVRVPDPAFQHRLHIGLYAYRRHILEAFCAWLPSPLERIEALEQLRLLHHGLSIGVVDVEPFASGIDTQEDLDRVRRFYSEA